MKLVHMKKTEPKCEESLIWVIVQVKPERDSDCSGSQITGNEAAQETRPSQKEVHRTTARPSKIPVAETRYTVEISDVVFRFSVHSAELPLADALV